ARATGGYDGINRRGHDGLDPAPILVGGVLLENLRTSAVVQFWPNRNRLVPKWSSPPRPRLNMLSPLVAPNSFALVCNQAIRPADFNLRIRSPMTSRRLKSASYYLSMALFQNFESVAIAPQYGEGPSPSRRQRDR